jgi:hypothetical protein
MPEDVEQITIEEIMALQWTKPEHCLELGVEKVAGAIRSLASRLLDEIAIRRQVETRLANLEK